MQETATGSRTIRERREALGWTKTHLAEAAGITRPTLISLEHGGRKKTQPGTRRKVEATLSEAEQERQEHARRFGMNAHNAVARSVADLEDLIERGALSPGGMILCLRSVVDAYADRIEKIDPEAVGQAVEYTASLVKARMRTRVERN
jgi:transcriptional regulator with XRE-family HTH domain